MYQRGERVVVAGMGGRESTLLVWEDHGQGVALTTANGYQRALSGDPEAPIVGYPRRDVRGRADDLTQPVTREEDSTASTPKG